MKCAVVGAGAWGTALACVLARNGETVALWAREREVVESINARHVNELFLPGMPLPDGVRADDDLAAVLPVAVASMLGPASPLFVVSLLVGAFVFWTHRANIARLRRGEEHRFGRRGAAAAAAREIPTPPTTSGGAE